MPLIDLCKCWIQSNRLYFLVSMRMRQLFSVGKILLLLVLAWLLVLVFVGGPLIRGSDGQEEVLAKRLVESQGEVAALRRERDALARNLRTMGKGEQAEEAIREASSPAQPSSAYEEARRKAARDTRELWNFARVRLEDIGKENSKLEKKLNEMISELETREQAVLVDLEQLRASDGFEEWREKEAKDLSALVQARLHFLQNPADCSSARKLVCNLNKGCGYGCQIHHAIYCFLVAYGTERTLILKSKGWRYNKKGFENVFLPLSETCTEAEGGSRSSWPGKEETQIVELPIVDSVNPRPPFLPQAVPADLVERISRLHGDPIVWWVSQFLLYMLRPQPHLTGSYLIFLRKYKSSPCALIFCLKFILFSQICFSRLLLVSELKDRWSGFTSAEQTRLAGILQEPQFITRTKNQP